MSTRTKMVGVALALIAPVLAVVSTTTASQADTASDLTAKFQAYGNTSGQWSGGDGTQSIKLSDDRVLWFFSDTFHGSVTDGKRLAFTNPYRFINNSMVIQDANGSLVDTVEGDFVGEAVSMVAAAEADKGEFLWGAGQTVANGAVYKFYQRTELTGKGSLDFLSVGAELVKMPISTITRPSTFSKVTLPPQVAGCGNSKDQPRCTLWGVDLLDYKDPADQKTYTYIYGVDNDPKVKGAPAVDNDKRGEKYLKIARVPQGDFTVSGWRFWNGSGWVQSADQAIRVMRGVQEGFSVAPVDGRLVLLTQDSGNDTPDFTADMYSYSSETPTGFTRASRSHLYATPETTVDAGRHTYEYRIVEHLTSGNTIVASYNQNSFYGDSACNRDNVWNASVYRPRFVTLTVPTTPRGGSEKAPTQPAPPTWTTEQPDYCKDKSTVAIPAPKSLTTTALSGGRLNLQWQDSKPGTWIYDMQYRDATAQQSFESATAPKPDTRTRTGFFFAPSPNKWEIGGLHHGHRYEFRVRAHTWLGRSSSWVTVSGTAKLLAPTNVTATKPKTGTCRVSWTDGQPSVMWQVRERNSRTGAQRILGHYMTKSVDLGKPLANDTYAYAVRAGNSKAPGPWSSTASC